MQLLSVVCVCIDEHSPFLKMSATSPWNNIKIGVLLTPQFMTVVTSTEKCKHMHGSLNLTGVTKCWNSCMLWVSGIMNIQKDCRGQTSRAGQFTKNLELRCAAYESVFLAFQTFLTPISGPNQSQPGRQRDWIYSPVVRAFIAIRFKQRQEEGVPDAVPVSQQPSALGTALAESRDLHQQALMSAVTPGLLIILQALSSLKSFSFDRLFFSLRWKPLCQKTPNQLFH